MDNSDVITEVTLDAISLVEEPDFVTPFATHDEVGDTEDLAHNGSMASEQDLSKTPATQLAENDSQAEDLDGDVPFRLYIKDLELQCTTEEFELPDLHTVRLPIIGLATGEMDVWFLKRVSRDTWKQASTIDLSMNTDRGLIIAATAEDFINYAHMHLTKDELALDVETNEAQISKCLISEVGVPTLKLSFVVIGLPEEEMMDEADSDDESAQTAWELARRGIDLTKRFERVGNLADLEEAISVQRRAIQLTPNGHEDMPAWLNNLGNSYQCRFEHTGELSDIEEAISLQQRAVQLAPNGHANMPGWLNNLGNSYMRRFERTGEIPDITEAISRQQQALQLTPNGHADMPLYLDSAGNSYQCYFERSGDLPDIEEAISLQQQAVRLTPNGDTDMQVRLNNLGNSCLRRFERTGELSDISEAISIQNQALQLIPNGHADMPGCLSNLGISYRRRFDRMGDFSDMSEAISAQQRAVELTPSGHADMPMYLNNLGNSYLGRFKRTGELLDMSEAISTQQRAVELTPNGHADMPGRLNNLGNSYLGRFKRTCELSDILEAILIQQQAVQLTPNGHANMPMYLDSLGVSFLHRFKQTGDLPDIEEAISLQRQAIQLTPNGDADTPIYLNNLGTSCRCRFERTGELSGIKEAISAQQQAVQLTPNGHTDMPMYLNELGGSFLHRFEHTGDLLDIEEAISLQQRAVQLTSNGDADMPMYLNNLGNSYLGRFERTRELSDIEEAISAQQRAVQLTPNDHADMPVHLNNLGISYQRRFEYTKDLSDVKEAISAHQQVVQLTPNGHTDMPCYLNNLGISFRCRFEHAGDLFDISEAISKQRRAIELTRNDHVEMPMYLNNLGSSYQRRFEHTGESSDIEEAISAQQQAVQLTPNGHTAMPLRLHYLGNLYLRRFDHTTNPKDMYTALSRYQQSATAFGPPSVRLNASKKWAQLSMTHDPSQSLTAYGVAIDLISQIAGMDRTIEQRHTHLIQVSILTTSAASTAFMQGDIEKALEWLEQGRCLVWSQLNQLRTPVDNLGELDEHLAQRFIDISSALESSGSRRGPETLNINAPLPQKMSLQDEAHTHVKLAGEWNQLLNDIRRISGFHNFLRPHRTSDLLKDLPPDGPIIIINVHETRCDALALISGVNAPVHIPLHNFTYKLASELRERLRIFLSSRGVRLRDEDRGPRPVLDDDVETQSEIHFILEELWRRVVRPILDGLEYSPHAPLNPRRLWWCPTGPLAFLPLHAAGIYSQNVTSTPGSCISDFAVSSYTPTVSALLTKVKGSGVQPLSLSKLLIISQPNTPGRSPIPCTTKEMDAIWRMTGSSSLCLEAEAATVSQVKLEMASHSSVHFACHATQDVKKPLKSGFYLHDGRLELAEIMQQRIPHSELAFLSACQTSAGDEKLSEESVHLAAGMLAVGYRSVVATMWSIKDKYGPVMAESFYEYLMDKGSTLGKPKLDTGNAAQALHHAIQGIRGQVGDTERGILTWVPYVHFGY